MHDQPLPVQRPTLEATLFSLQGLFYRYPDETLALSDIHLDIAPGDRIALVGQNGSGKTTLIKLLCGLLQPTAGQVRYKNQVIEGEYLEHSRLKIGLLFQDPDDQLFGHTLLEDAAFGPRCQGLPQPEAEAAAQAALQHVGLAAMRAALAGLLAMKPEVLLLDEPTANLDPHQEQVFLDLLIGFSGTLICISHDLIFLYELCDRAVVLNQGRIGHDYTLRELVSQRQALREHGLDFSFRLVAAPAHDEPARPSIAKPEAVTATNAGPTASPVVDLRRYTYRYPDGTLALRDASVSVRAGERIAFVGENGAGKTTLLSCMLGLHQGQGEFLFDGRPVTRRRRKALWRQVGMVFQDSADQLFCPSVEEEIAFGLHQMGLSPTEIRQRVDRTLSLVRLEGFEDRVPLHLSGGERKRLALACVLAMEPKLLILDEPTAGLDPRGEELLLTILRQLNVTLLIVSHDMFFVGELTRRTLVMHKGSIIEDVPTHAFLQDERLGNLNGLAYAYRRRSGEAIHALQHEHEHDHRHRHLHAHPHPHGDITHEHLHEHEHRHPHRFMHSHPGEESGHDHLPRRYHDHDHPDHDEDHDHSH
ncbi:MAG: energy-coupling factor transporter ATPase [Desulfobacteraceae bacterium]